MNQTIAFAVTLISETAVLFLLAKNNFRAISASIFSNSITHPVAWYFVRSASLDCIVFAVFFAEIVIVLVEAGIYRLFFRLRGLNLLVWSLATNSASFLLGLGFFILKFSTQ